MSLEIQENFMREALREARLAYELDEVPVGAVVVKDGEIIARAHNEKEGRNCSLFHAEMLAVERACEKLGQWWLEDCDIYITLEPCPMCCGALINSRISKVIFGAYDKKAGSLGSLYNLNEGKLNHTFEASGGVLENECGEILSAFFKEKRMIKKSEKGEKQC